LQVFKNSLIFYGALKTCTVFIIVVIITIYLTSTSISISRLADSSNFTVTDKVEFITSDDFIIKATLYHTLNKDDRPVIILLHSLNSSQDSFNWLIPLLIQKKLNILTLDFRGHGKSIYMTSGHETHFYSMADIHKNSIFKDVEAAISFLTEHPAVNTDHCILLGASLGANVALITGYYNSDKVKRVIAISPYSRYRKYDISRYIKNIDRATYLITSEGDTPCMKAIKEYSILNNLHINIIITKGSDHGLEILKNNPALIDEIITSAD